MSEVTENPDVPEKSDKKWYVVQAFSQYEGRVKKTLLEYIKMHEIGRAHV